MLRLFVFKIHQEEHTLLQLKEVLMLLRIIKVMVILFIDYFMILLKEATTGLGKKMFID